MSKTAAKALTLDSLLSGGDVSAAVAELNFEDGLKLLEALVGAVESGSLPLERAVTSYEGGSKLVEHLRALLSGAEERIRVLQKPV
jgi:exodeoxyribonuclease VII small subunit